MRRALNPREETTTVPKVWGLHNLRGISTQGNMEDTERGGQGGAGNKLNSQPDSKCSTKRFLSETTNSRTNWSTICKLVLWKNLFG